MNAYPLTPFARSYWVVPGRLLAGAFPGAKDEADASRKLEALFDAGIRCIVTLMEPDERDLSGAPFVDYAPMFERIAANSGAIVRCRRFSVPDLGVPDVATMHRILNAIDAAVADGIPVMVSFILLEIAEIGILILDRMAPPCFEVSFFFVASKAMTA